MVRWLSTPHSLILIFTLLLILSFANRQSQAANSIINRSLQVLSRRSLVINCKSSILFLRYSKVCRYDFLAHAAKSKAVPVKEFTQVVWRGTKKLGVGRATSHLGKPCTYIVARYFPRHDPAVRRTNVDIGDFNKEICKDSRYVGFGAKG